jgi:hypothetical protein
MSCPRRTIAYFIIISAIIILFRLRDFISEINKKAATYLKNLKQSFHLFFELDGKGYFYELII